MSEPVKRYYDSRLGTFISGDKPTTYDIKTSSNYQHLHQTTTNYGTKSGEPHICAGCLKPIEIGKSLQSLHIQKEPREGLIIHYTKRFHDLICFEIWDKSDGVI